MPDTVKEIKAQLEKQLAERIRQASIDNFKLFQQFLNYEEMLLLSTSSKKVIVYDAEHAAITQRDIFKKIVECTKIQVIDKQGPKGEITSHIQVTCDGLDLSRPYVMESFQTLLNNVNTRMKYNIRS